MLKQNNVGEKNSTEIPLSLFCIGHLLQDMGTSLSVVIYPVRLHCGKVTFLRSCQLEIAF